MTHAIAHVFILSGYIAAMVLVPSALRSLIEVRTATSVTGAAFFLLCGITHTGLALGGNDWLPIIIADHLQAGAILSFIPLLYVDLQNALERFGQVLDEVDHPTVGPRIAAALQNTAGWQDPDRWH